MEQAELFAKMTTELLAGAEHVRKLCTELSLAVQEIRRLNKWIDDLQSGMFINCVYCGYQYGPSTEAIARESLERHIESCQKHPLSIAKAEIATLAAKLVSNRGCIGYTLDLEIQNKALTKKVAELDALRDAVKL